MTLQQFGTLQAMYWFTTIQAQSNEDHVQVFHHASKSPCTSILSIVCYALVCRPVLRAEMSTTGDGSLQQAVAGRGAAASKGNVQCARLSRTKGGTAVLTSEHDVGAQKHFAAGLALLRSF